MKRSKYNNKDKRRFSKKMSYDFPKPTRIKNGPIDYLVHCTQYPYMVSINAPCNDNNCIPHTEYENALIKYCLNLKEH